MGMVASRKQETKGGRAGVGCVQERGEVARGGHNEGEARQFSDVSGSSRLRLKSGLDREGGRRLKWLGSRCQWSRFSQEVRIKKGRLITAWDQRHAECQRGNRASSQASSGIC